MQTGQTWALGASPKPPASQPQNIWLRVCTARWISSPMTGSGMRSSLAGRSAPLRYASGMIRMRLDDIAVSGEGKQFLLLLRADEDERVLPIVVDAMQALAIAAGRSGEKPSRPLTHDLVLSLLEVQGVQVEITDLVEGTFYSMLVVERGGVRFDIDARPSDALAVAVRVDAPILVAEEVLENSGLDDETGEGGFEA